MTYLNPVKEGKKTLKKFLYKIVIVGDGAVGKTTILHRYVDEKFVEDTLMTIGSNFFIKEIPLEECNVSIKLQIWDLGGQEHFAAVRPSFYSGSKGIIYTFDLTRQATFYNLIKWKDEISNIIGNNIPCILIGNKSDLLEINENFPKEELQILKNELQFGKFYITSAKNNIGIDRAFREFTREIFLKNS
jgi:Ras-related protein Rab-7A